MCSFFVCVFFFLLVKCFFYLRFLFLFGDVHFFVCVFFFCLCWPFWATLKKEKKKSKKNKRSGMQNSLAERNEGSGNEIAPFQTWCCPRTPCGGSYCHPGKGAVLLAGSLYCLLLENIAGSFFGDKVSFEGYSYSVAY